MLPQTISTQRLALKKLDKSYSKNILEENKSNVANYFIPFANINEVNQWIEENITMYEQGEKIEMVVLGTQNREFLGMISIRNLKTQPEFGLWIKESGQGKGYAKESAKALLDWCIATYPNKTVRYEAEKSNTASVNLTKALNLKFVTEFIDDSDGSLNVRYES